MTRTQVYMWFTRFKNCRDDLNDDPRPGQPEASNRAELVEKVSEKLNLSYCTIYTILTEDLGKRVFDEKTDFCHRPPSVFA